MTTADIMFAQPGNPESLRDHEYEKRTVLLALLAAILIHLLVAFFLAAFGGIFSPATPVEDKPARTNVHGSGANSPEEFRIHRDRRIKKSTRAKRENI